MKAIILASVVAQALAIVAVAVDSSLKRDVDNWNSVAWSNFVKVYAVDDAPSSVKRDEKWNAAAWSNFIKSYVDDFEAGKKN